MSAVVLTPSASEGLFAPGRRALSLGAVALVSMIAFEAIAVAAAMPVVAQALHGLDRFALAFGGTMAMSMLGMVWAGGDCDRHGPRRAMSLGLALFGLGLLVAGAAQQMVWLLVGRLVQGLGAGMLGVAIYVAMGRLLPEALRPRLFALFAAAWVLPAILGPALAGLLVDTLGWRWVFLGVALLLLPTAFMVLPALWHLRGAASAPPSQSGRGRRLAWALIAALGALSLHAASTNGQSNKALWLAGGLLALLCAAQRLLPRGSLRSARGLPTVIALRGLLAAAFFSAEVYIPLWLNLQRGWSVAEAGVALSLGALCWSVGSQIQARLHDEVRRHAALRWGLLAVAVSGAGLTGLVLSNGPAWTVLPLWLLAGLGIGIAFPMLSVLTLKFSAEHEQGSNSSALQLSDALSSSAVLAANGAAFALLYAEHPQWAFACVFGLTAAMTLLGGTLVTRVASVGRIY